jgi:hypothetical protein
VSSTPSNPSQKKFAAKATINLFPIGYNKIIISNHAKGIMLRLALPSVVTSSIDIASFKASLAPRSIS